MATGISLSRVDGDISFALDGLTARQRAIANNIANVDTPQFKGSEVRFEQQLARATSRQQGTSDVEMFRTDERHLSFGGASGEVAPEVVQLDETTLRNDGNNVDIDQEMVKLADTQIRYDAAVRLVSQRYGMLQSIITEGRR